MNGLLTVKRIAAIHKGTPKIKFQFVPAQRQSVLGGLPAVEALAQEFRLWSKLRALEVLDPRTRKGRGFGPDAIVAQLIYCFAAGGTSLADAERLEADPLARQLARMASFAAPAANSLFPSCGSGVFVVSANRPHRPQPKAKTLPPQGRRPSRPISSRPASLLRAVSAAAHSRNASVFS